MDDRQKSITYGQSVNLAAQFWLGQDGVDFSDDEDYTKTILLTADKIYAELKTRQEALLVRTPLQSSNPTPREMAADMAAVDRAAVASAPDTAWATEAAAGPPPQDYEEPPDEEVREGMASMGVGKHNPDFWAPTDIRCPGCGKATLVKKTGEFGPDYQCSTKEQLKTERLNEKTGKPVYVDVGPCAYTQWPARS